MIRNLLVTAMLTGLIAGLGVTVFQQRVATPLILEAEVYENAESAAVVSTSDAAPHIHGAEQPAIAGQTSGEAGTQANAHDHNEGQEEWAPADGWERMAYSAAANILGGIGFAMLLIGCFVLRGREVDAKIGLLWGLAGFVVFTAAPFFGLPAELPGMPAGNLVDRQIWWLATVATTAAGIAFIAFPVAALHRSIGIGLGLALVIAPHVIGAPQPSVVGSAVPATLEGEFVIASLGSSAILWFLLGGVGGWLYSRRAASGGMSASFSS
jgi:cobalt transporter subunit CbtA